MIVVRDSLVQIVQCACLLVSGNLLISLVGPESLSCKIGFILFGWSVIRRRKK